MKIIAIGGLIASGKNTLGLLLKEYLEGLGYPVKLYGVADKPKQMVAALLGVSLEQMEDREFKDNADTYLLERYGVTPRDLVKSIANKWGRKRLSNEIWIDALIDTIQRDTLSNPNQISIITDMRYEWEWKSLGEVISEDEAICRGYYIQSPFNMRFPWEANQRPEGDTLSLPSWLKHLEPALYKRLTHSSERYTPLNGEYMDISTVLNIGNYEQLKDAVNYEHLRPLLTK